VEFDLPPGSESHIECLNIPPDSPESRSLLKTEIEDAINHSDTLQSALEKSGVNTTRITGPIAEALDRSMAWLESGNWSQALLEFHRSTHSLPLVTNLTKAFEETWKLIQTYKAEDLGASILEDWYRDAMTDFEEGRHGGAMDRICRIESLERSHWFLAHDIDEAIEITNEAADHGWDTTQQGYRLKSIIRLFQDGKYTHTRNELDRLGQRWPEIYGVSETPILLVLLIIMIMITSKRIKYIANCLFFMEWSET